MKNETWSSSDIFLFMWLARLLEKRAILNIWENRVIIPKIKLKTQNIELKAKKPFILLITVLLLSKVTRQMTSQKPTTTLKNQKNLRNQTLSSIQCQIES